MMCLAQITWQLILYVCYLDNIYMYNILTNSQANAKTFFSFPSMKK